MFLSHAQRPWSAQNRKLDQYIQPNVFAQWREDDHYSQTTNEALKLVSITGKDVCTYDATLYQMKCKSSTIVPYLASASSKEYIKLYAQAYREEIV